MLTLYKPQCGDLWFKQTMMADKETMSYNHAYGGTIPFPEEKWQTWYDRWFCADGKRYYRYLRSGDGAFVGEIAFYFDEEKNVYLADVVVYARYRGKGYGGEGLELLCAVARENGIIEMYDEITADNPSIRLFKKHGFSEVFRTEKTVMLKRHL